MTNLRSRFSQFGFLALILLLSLVVAACGGGEAQPTLEPGSGGLVELEVSSPDFGDMEGIPSRFTCDGDAESPRLEWDPVPEGTESLVIIVDDPDAPGGIFNHWVVYDIPADVRQLDGDQPRGETLPSGGVQGTNDAEELGWSGPCPPSGPAHQYDFYLYGLTSALELSPGAKRDEVVRAMREAGVIGVGTLSGLYARQ